MSASGGGALGGTQTIGTLELDGGFAGLQAGYLWALRSALVGLEVGVTGGGPSDDIDADAGRASAELQHEVSLRGMIGAAVSPDSLFYGFAGASRAAFDYTAKGPDAADIDESFSRTGYIVGLGWERAIGESWSLRGEYRYSNYGKETLSDGTGHKTEATPAFHAVSLGLNLRF